MHFCNIYIKDAHVKQRSCTCYVPALSEQDILPDKMDIHTEQTYVARLPEPVFHQGTEQRFLFPPFATTHDFRSGHRTNKRCDNEILADAEDIHTEAEHADFHTEASASDTIQHHCDQWPSILSTRLDAFLQSHIRPNSTSSSRSSSHDRSTQRNIAPQQQDSNQYRLANVVFSQSGLLGCLDGLEQTERDSRLVLNHLYASIHNTAFDDLLQSAGSISEDALSLDHPCRFYDVKNFVDRWKLAYSQGRAYHYVSTNPESSLWSLQQDRCIYRQDLHKRSGSDVQGINWRILGTSREEALAARVAMNADSVADDCPRRREAKTETMYKFHSFHGRHRARFAHYQLRNVVAATSRSDIFYASGNKVFSANLALPKKQEVVMTTKKMETTYRYGMMPTARDPTATKPFCITCLATSPPSFSDCVSSSVLLAGGYNGEYSLLNLDSDSTSTPTQGLVSHAFDGLVTHISIYNHRRSGNLQAAFCTNDSEVRVMDLPTQQFVLDLRYPFVMNASCASQDGRLRALVGDSCETLITDVDRGDVQATLSAHTNYSFACAWSPSQILLATASQDGTVKLWDARNWQTPLQSTPCLRSCVRWLDFTADNQLVMAENDDVVSIYDPTVDAMQDLTFFGSVAGAALLDGGSEIAISISDRTVGGLLVYDRASLAHHSEPVYSLADKQSLARRQQRQNKWSSMLDGIVL